MRERAWPSVKLLAPGCGAPGLFCGRVLTALFELSPLLLVPRALVLEFVVLPIEVFTFGLPTGAVPSAFAPWPPAVSAVFGLPVGPPAVLALLRAELLVVPADEPFVALVPVPTELVVVVAPVLLLLLGVCA